MRGALSAFLWILASALVMVVKLGQADARKPPSMPVCLQSAASALDSARILEDIQVAIHLDRKLAEKLKRSATIHEFSKLIAEAERNDPAPWSELLSRIAFCRKHGYLLDGSDVRLSLILEHGPWKSEWVEPMECNRDTCKTWIYTFEPSEKFPDGITVACEGDPGGSFPVRTAYSSDVQAPLAGVLYPYVVPSLLPNWGSDLQRISVGITVPADQLSRPTLCAGRLSMRLEVHDRSRPRDQVVARDAIMTNLEPLRAILARSRRAQWGSCGAQGFLGCELRPGEYSVRIDVSGDHLNEGTVTLNFTVPKDPMFSDLILTKDVLAAGLDAGVQRNGENFYSISRPEFVAGQTVNVRLECKLPRSFGGRCHAWATLVPIPEVHDRSPRPQAKVLDVVYWEDEGGKPMYGSMLPSEMSWPVSKDPKSMTLLDRSYQALPEVFTLEEPVRLSARPGRYLLAMQISGSENGQEPLGTKAMVIRLLPGH